MTTATIEPTQQLILPARQPMLSPVSWRVLIFIVIAVLALVPICSMLVPEGSPFHLSAYALTLVGKIMCYAIGALALDLVWGYCGILSLGHVDGGCLYKNDKYIQVTRAHTQQKRSVNLQTT